MKNKLITFIVPCYNSAKYLDRCVESVIQGTKEYESEIEIILVNDGSSDSTPKMIDDMASKWPKIIRAVHQPNKGHGGAINTGLKKATGDYLKVVDSDDWLSKKNLSKLLATLKKLREEELDMMVFNYVYDGKSYKSMGYEGSLPSGRILTWDDVGRFGPSNYILMHSVIFRTEVLRKMKLSLPEHTFYVDNIFVYTTLPNTKKLYYENMDIYHYYIGREDQSVNEKVMISRIDQQLKITRILIDSVNFCNKKMSIQLRKYLVNYLSMMMTISSLFSILANKQKEKDELWNYLERKNPAIYQEVRKTFLGNIANRKSKFSQQILVKGYRIVRQIWHMN